MTLEAVGKDRRHPRTSYEGLGREYSCTLSLASALDGLGDQRHAPAALPTGMTRNPLYRRWVGPRTRLDRCGKPCSHRVSIHGQSRT